MNPENHLDPQLGEPLSRPCVPLLATKVSKNSTLLPRDTWSGNPLPATVQSADEDICSAVTAASDAFESGPWHRQSKAERRDALLRWATLIEQHRDLLAYVNCMETGRSLKSLRDDSVPKAVAALRWFAELSDKLDDRSVHTGKFGTDFAIVRREPVGIVAAILPWNDPLVTLAWKVAPALAVGNSVIVKPSEHAPIVTGEAIRLAHSAGIPQGVLQMLTGDGRVGSRLIRQPGISKIAFTGSSHTASLIGAEAYQAGLKTMSFECGGKGAFIVCPSGRQPEEFAAVVAKNIFYNQGQICSAPSIVHAPDSIAGEIAERIAGESYGYIPNNPLSSQTAGFMVSRDIVTRLRSSLRELSDDLFVGDVNDRKTPPATLEWSITPTVLLGLGDDHAFWDTELFAPILLVRPYKQIEEALAHARKSRYGLAAGVWSQDIDECMHIAAELRAGTVHINSWGDDPEQIPFGGIKESGHGREKSTDAFDSYTYLKSIFYRPRSKI